MPARCAAPRMRKSVRHRVQIRVQIRIRNRYQNVTVAVMTSRYVPGRGVACAGTRP